MKCGANNPALPAVGVFKRSRRVVLGLALVGCAGSADQTVTLDSLWDIVPEPLVVIGGASADVSDA